MQAEPVLWKETVLGPSVVHLTLYVGALQAEYNAWWASLS